MEQHKPICLGKAIIIDIYEYFRINRANTLKNVV